MKKYDLDNRIAVVTGAAMGIGKCIAATLAEQGAVVVVADMNLEKAQETVKEIEAAGGNASAVYLDLTKEETVTAAFEEIRKQYKTVHILVNNAGKPGVPPNKDIFDKPLSDWDDLYKTNLRGTVLVTREVYHLMKNQKWGKIVNIASISGKMPSPTTPGYGTFKAGVIQYTKTLAKDLAAFNVNVNSICPGFLYTPLWQKGAAQIAANYPEGQRPEPYAIFQAYVQKTTPMQREQTVEDIANLAAFLSSEDSRNITGQSISVDGGCYME